MVLAGCHSWGVPGLQGQDQAYLFLEALWGFPSNSRLSVLSCCQLGRFCSFFTIGSCPGRSLAMQAAASLNIWSASYPMDGEQYRVLSPN